MRVEFPTQISGSAKVAGYELGPDGSVKGDLRRQKQKYRHNPPEFIGDCHRTAIACVIGVPRDAVPHFAEVHWEDPDKFHESFERWLENQGYTCVTMAFGGDGSLDDILAGVGHFNPELFYILGGQSKNGTGHSVVCKGSEIYWDPALDDSGIIGPNEGSYWITFIAGNPKAVDAKYRNAGVWQPDGSKFVTYRDEKLAGLPMYVYENDRGAD